MNNRKTAVLQLPVHKQGDDLGHCLRQTATVREALIAYTDTLAVARAMLQALSVHAARREIAQADAHLIEIEGPARLGDRLIARGLLSPLPDEHDE